MKIKLAQIVSNDFQTALRNLSGLSFQTFAENRAVAKLWGQLKGEIEAYQKTHLSILSKYGTPVENAPSQFKIDQSKAADFKTELDALMETVVDVELAAPIKGEALKALCGRDLCELAPFLGDA